MLSEKKIPIEEAKQKFEHAMACQSHGEFEQALELLHEVTEHYPNHALAFSQVAEIYNHMNRYMEEARALEKTVALEKNNPTFYFRLGNCYYSQGMAKESIENFEKVLLLNPDHENTLFNLGCIYARTGQREKAEKYYKKALEVEPNRANTLLHLGRVYMENGEHKKAQSCFEKAQELDKGNVEILDAKGWNNLLQDKFEEAYDAFDLAIAHAPSYIEPIKHMGLLFLKQKKVLQAISYFRRAILMNPEDSFSHYYLAYCLLIQGKFEEGWEEYECRLQSGQAPYHKPFSPVLYDKPKWKGEALEGKTLYVYYEQGFGDTFQYLRYLPQVKKVSKAKIIYGTQRSLKPLLKDHPSIDQLIVKGDEPPLFDAYVSLASLPYIFKTELETVPAEVPYLTASQELVETWKSYFEKEKRLKVGLVWAGTAGAGTISKGRACGLKALESLFQLKNVAYYGLQMGEGRKDLLDVSPPDNFTDLAGKWPDTAAIMTHLDLIISVDTSSAHLAGALAKPVWVLLPFLPCFRWLLDREDSQWYPTMRLFRQEKRDAWKPVIQSVKKELEKLAKS